MAEKGLTDETALKNAYGYLIEQASKGTEYAKLTVRELKLLLKHAGEVSEKTMQGMLEWAKTMPEHFDRMGSDSLKYLKERWAKYQKNGTAKKIEQGLKEAVEKLPEGEEPGLDGVKAVVERCSSSFKFFEMTEDEIARIVEIYRKKAPIEIPQTAKYKAKSMAGGYEQISYKWNDGIYKYEVRWHTRTPGAPEGQGNTWVIQRTIPGSGGTKPATQFLIGENEWIEGWKWYDAINARKNGTATQEQIELLNKGHWKE